MPLSGTNKFCQQCIRTCKQWEQIQVIKCPHFTSTQKKEGKLKRDIPFNLDNRAKSACIEAILES